MWVCGGSGRYAATPLRLRPDPLLHPLQDVIEELICSEIVDETDIFVDNERLTLVNQVRRTNFHTSTLHFLRPT